MGDTKIPTTCTTIITVKEFLQDEYKTKIANKECEAWMFIDGIFGTTEQILDIETPSYYVVFVNTELNNALMTFPEDTITIHWK